MVTIGDRRATVTGRGEFELVKQGKVLQKRYSNKKYRKRRQHRREVNQERRKVETDFFLGAR